MNCRAILFDLDGVIVNARQWHKLAFESALTHLGIEISDQYYQEHLEALSTRQKLAFLVEQKKVDDRYSRDILQVKQSLTREIVSELCRPDPAITELLRTIELMNVPRALCTNSIRKTTEQILSQMQITNFFDLILTNEDVKNPKPSPEIYERASEILGVALEKCLVVEDSDVGVRAAQAAGTKLFRVSNSYDLIQRSSEILNRVEPPLRHVS